MNDNRHHFRTSASLDGLRRSRSNGIIFGVCAGIADFFALDPTIVRITAFLLLWIFTMPTLVLYLLLAILAESR